MNIEDKFFILKQQQRFYNLVNKHRLSLYRIRVETGIDFKTLAKIMCAGPERKGWTLSTAQKIVGWIDEHENDTERDILRFMRMRKRSTNKYIVSTVNENNMKIIKNKAQSSIALLKIVFDLREKFLTRMKTFDWSITKASELSKIDFESLSSFLEGSDLLSPIMNDRFVKFMENIENVTDKELKDLLQKKPKAFPSIVTVSPEPQKTPTDSAINKDFIESLISTEIQKTGDLIINHVESARRVIRDDIEHVLKLTRNNINGASDIKNMISSSMEHFKNVLSQIRADDQAAEKRNEEHMREIIKEEIDKAFSAK